jgi:restriction endonuclease S subunit
MKRIPVPIPSLVKQREIVEKLDNVYEEIDRIRNKNAIKKDFAGNLRQSLLRQSFSRQDEKVSA